MSYRKGQHEAPNDFGEVVDEMETRAVNRRQFIDVRSAWFRGTTVAIIIGGVWGVAVAFTSFRNSQAADHADLVKLRNDFDARKSHVLSAKELDIWAEAMRNQNGLSKIIVPKPSDYKIEQ